MSNKAQLQLTLLRAIDANTAAPVANVATQYGLARQTVSEYLRELVKKGQVKISGRGKSTKYEIVEQKTKRQFALTGALMEDQAWGQAISPLVEDLSDNERSIFQYGFTEMVNNAIDHSEGSMLSITTAKSAIKITITVQDNGVGIFQKIAKALNLSDPRQSLIELSKGKFTTDPRRHTGEGIFFTSRIFDYFALTADKLALIHRESSDDWLIEPHQGASPGTHITMTLALPSIRKLEEVFKKYSSGPEDYTFARTHVPLSLARYGKDELVSRSQAKRILSRVDSFAEVLLDFNGIDRIGQGFADEIFRVFSLQHPGISVLYVNANNTVEGMILRAIANRVIGDAKQPE